MKLVNISPYSGLFICPHISLFITYMTSGHNAPRCLPGPLVSVDFTSLNLTNCRLTENTWGGLRRWFNVQSAFCASVKNWVQIPGQGVTPATPMMKEWDRQVPEVCTTPATPMLEGWVRQIPEACWSAKLGSLWASVSMKDPLKVKVKGDREDN